MEIKDRVIWIQATCSEKAKQQKYGAGARWPLALAGDEKNITKPTFSPLRYSEVRECRVSTIARV
jgi:hypothetical protein